MPIRTKSGKIITEAEAIRTGQSGTIIKKKIPIGIKRPRSGGGSITVDRGGKVTERDSQGNLIKTYFIPVKQARAIVIKESGRISTEVKLRIRKTDPLAVKRPTATGGTITVSRGGKVTERNKQGKIIRTYTATPKSTIEFLRREGAVVKQELKELQARKKAAKIKPKQKTFFVLIIDGDPIVIPETIVKRFNEDKNLRSVTIKGKKITRQTLKKQGITKTITPSGTISVDKTKTLSLKKAHIELDKLQQKAKKRFEFSQKATAPLSVITLALIGAVKGVVSALTVIRHPIISTKAIAKAIFLTPVKTFKALGQEFQVNPVGVIAEFATFTWVFRIVGRAAKANPVSQTLLMEAFILRQPKVLRKPIRIILKAADVQKAINPRKIKTIKTLNFAEVKSLTVIEAKALKKAVIETDSVLFGSIVPRAFTKKAKIPEDVDLATKNIDVFNKAFIKNLPKSQRNNYFVKGQKMKRKSDNRPLYDVKPLSRIIQQRSILTKKGKLPVSGYVTRSKGIERLRTINELTKKLEDLTAKIKTLKPKSKQFKKILKEIRQTRSQLQREIKKYKPSQIPQTTKKAIKGAFEVGTQKLLTIGKVKKKLTISFKVKGRTFKFKRDKFTSNQIKNTLNIGDLQKINFKKGQWDFHKIDGVKGVVIPLKYHKVIHAIQNNFMKGKSTTFYKILRQRKLNKKSISELNRILPKISKSGTKLVKKFNEIQKGGIGVIPKVKLTKIKGIKMIGFGEQTLRKALGTIQVLIEKNVRRAKDPQAFLISLEVQIRFLKKAKPRTIVGRLRNKRRIKKLEEATKLLKSKSFAKLLDSKVPGLTKAYPLVSKINTAKLRKINLKAVRKEVTKQVSKKLKVKEVKKKKIVVKKKKVVKPKKKKLTRKQKASRLARLRRQRKSKIPRRKKPSKIPKKRRPSRIPKRRPSRIPKKKPSRIPKKKPSKIPKARPSKIPPLRPPSRIPGRKPSRLPGRKPSRITGIIRRRLIKKIPKKFKRKITKKKDKKALIKWFLKQPTVFRPSLVAILFNITSFKIPKRITGFEIRPIIVRRPKIGKRIKKPRKKLRKPKKTVKRRKTRKKTIKRKPKKKTKRRIIKRKPKKRTKRRKKIIKRKPKKKTRRRKTSFF